MITHRPAPSESWAFIVTALAELGRAEIERRQCAAEVCAHVPAAEDQADGRLNSTSAMNETTEAPGEGITAVSPTHRAPNDHE